MRKLANKTQVFPVALDDEGRQRLTHSIEVAKLAATIGEALRLNTALIETGGLAHDIGHTPFGHAGEHAIHTVLVQIHKKLFFNHYEHGVDVVRYLEHPYQLHPGYPGLNLTKATAETIFKHIYWHRNDRVGKAGRPGEKESEVKNLPPPPPQSLAELHERSKHKSYLSPGYCHPEGQAVRLADKISYLISDIEDGIRLGAIQLGDLLRCRLFQRPPIDMISRQGESALAVFNRERKNVIRVLMEDAIETSILNWNLIGRDYNKVGSHTRYVISHSSEIDTEMKQVWDELQKGKLHQFSSVRLANMSAAKIVSELVVTFALLPSLVDNSFRESHERLMKSDKGRAYFDHYRETAGSSVKIKTELRSFLLLDRTLGESKQDASGEVKIEHLVQAKDYVASLTDSQATRLHRTIPNARSG